ncbi:hypothetical protein OCS_03688 [Ophiocordyceps sinensis CO18]|uniref:Uncharacterized protein n=1 Tax=Ophiocordyceps sinensis (strain Co18 / CGMCC 3.14243) TaxID=911162 RepID=T5A555_OPHSC|nr:hypothetical protein OCS_03688 [Ophiocordyceps sinensis CO18]
MKTCLVTILTLCLAGTGLAAPTPAVSAHLSQRHVAPLQDLVERRTDDSLSASESDALLADLIDDLDPAHGIHRRQPDANLVSAADAGDSKAGKSASDYYGPVKRESAAKQGELLGGLLQGLPLSGLVKRKMAAKQGKLLSGLLKGLPLSGLLKREMAAEQERAARQLHNMVGEEGLAALQQGTNKAHEKRDSEAPNINDLEEKIDGRLGDSTALALAKVMALLARDQDDLPTDSNIALEAANGLAQEFGRDADQRSGPRGRER